MTKHIGIVAGSSEGAALCYRTICLEAQSVMGEHNHPQITMHCVPMAEHMPHIEANDWAVKERRDGIHRISWRVNIKLWR
jgi:aspartate racemase